MKYTDLVIALEEVEADLKDYKFFCFNGEPKALFIASDRQKKDVETKFDFFDMDFKHLPIKNGHPNAEVPPAKPETFEEMKALAAKLSEGIPHVRVDFYEINGKTYFGEMTFSHWGGMTPFEPEKWDKVFGDWITIPDKTGHKDVVLYLRVERESELKDYKFFCFNGKVKCFKVDFGRFTEHHANYYDAEGRLIKGLGETAYSPVYDAVVHVPSNLQQMVALAEQLSQGLPFVRVDFYDTDDHKIYFGEFTFSPAGGMGPFVDEKWDYQLGEWIKLPTIEKNGIQ